jgi:predicted amidophosphoribosyltransferase
VVDDFIKTNAAHNTGKNSEQRLFTPHYFSGTITPGADYLIVDDISTTGATASYAARYINSQGGNVVGVIQLGITRRKPFHRATGPLGTLIPKSGWPCLNTPENG